MVATSTLFSLGTTAKGGKDKAGDFVNVRDSKLPNGFRKEGFIHTHTFDLGDRKLVWDVGTLYLATPKGKLKVISVKNGKGERGVPIQLPRYDR